MNVDSKIYKILALLGALPFIASAFMAMSHIDQPVSAGLVASSYGLAISSFLCGVHWATYLYRGADIRLNLFLSSNVLVVAVWLAYLFGSLATALGVQIVPLTLVHDLVASDRHRRVPGHRIDVQGEEAGREVRRALLIKHLLVVTVGGKEELTVRVA